MFVPHPRLFVSPAHLERLRRPVHHPVLQDAQREIEDQSQQFLVSRKLKYNPDLHNALLGRAREMQTRVVTLLVRWKQTGEERFRAAALDHIRDMAGWEHWCWEAEVQTPDPHRAINRLYDLSSGENSTTLALAYDLLAPTLSAEDRAVFAGMARARCFEPFLTVLKSQPAPAGQWLPGWWFKASHSNWNTVCSGGAGLLALAMHEEFPGLADEVLERVEESILPYFSSLAKTNGGWVEGIGYWNYGHRYAFLYVLGHERATGRSHPCLALPGVKETLSFPLDFTPNGQFCSFPDVNVWWPLPFHYEAAVRLGRPELVPVLDGCQPPREAKVRWWGDAAELLLFHPRERAPEPREETAVARRYPSMDWALLADRLPEPRLYMSIRGGSTKDPHAMVDVLSFHVVVGREKFIDNLSNRGGDDYLETTFSARRNDLFEMNQPAKNVVFINGVGLPADARAEMSDWASGIAKGFRLDASKAFGFLGENSPMADFCGRLFLMLDSRAFLILDRFELPRPGRVETRMHSHAKLEEGEGAGFLLGGKTGKLRIAYACTVEAVTATAVTCPTKPVPGAHVLRWCTVGRTHRRVTMATLLSPGAEKADVKIEEKNGRIDVHVVTEAVNTTISVSSHLE